MIYDLLAPFYDKYNGDINYCDWADFIEKVIEKHSAVKPELVLDLGCGTGRMTVELAKRGYDMTGIDYSPEMLDRARMRAESDGIGDGILWLCQDMSEFELYGTVDAAVCCLDCINHLTDTKSLYKCFDLVHNYLVPEGLFIFDVNAKYKFENIYSDETYAMDEDDAFCIWQNYYNEKTKLCDFYITLFKQCDDGKYQRFEEFQRERMYTLRSLKKALKANSLEFLAAYSGFDFEEGNDNCERMYIVAKCVKEN